MDDQALVDQLELVADKLGIQVRFEAGAGLGGLCTLRGESLLFVDPELPPEDQLHVMARALSGLDLSGVFMVPEVRDVLERPRPA